MTFDYRGGDTLCGVGGHTKSKFFPVTSCYIDKGGSRSLIIRIKIGYEYSLVCLLEVFQCLDVNCGNDRTLYAADPCEKTC